MEIELNEQEREMVIRHLKDFDYWMPETEKMREGIINKMENCTVLREEHNGGKDHG